MLVLAKSPIYQGIYNQLVVSTATLRLGKLKLKAPPFPALMVVVLEFTRLASPTPFIEKASGAVKIVKSALVPFARPSKVNETGTASVLLYTAPFQMCELVLLFKPATQ